MEELLRLRIHQMLHLLDVLSRIIMQSVQIAQVMEELYGFVIHQVRLR